MNPITRDTPILFPKQTDLGPGCGGEWGGDEQPLSPKRKQVLSTPRGWEGRASHTRAWGISGFQMGASTWE